MEIEPWMLALYMICGICFFIFLSVKITPRFAKKAILNGLKSEEGKVIMREVVLNAIEALDDEIEVPGAPDENGKPTVVKTTIGNLVMARVAQSIVNQIRYTFMGEKGNMGKELKAMSEQLAVEALPEQFRPMAAMMMPMLKKYPILSGLIGMAQAYQASKQVQAPVAGMTGNQPVLPRL